MFLIIRYNSKMNLRHRAIPNSTYVVVHTQEAEVSASGFFVDLNNYNYIRIIDSASLLVRPPCLYLLLSVTVQYVNTFFFVGSSRKFAGKMKRLYGQQLTPNPPSQEFLMYYY